MVSGEACRRRAWLDRHQRFTFHFTPTSCSWLNAVEGFFARLPKRRHRSPAMVPGVLRSHESQHQTLATAARPRQPTTPTTAEEESGDEGSDAWYGAGAPPRNTLLGYHLSREMICQEIGERSCKRHGNKHYELLAALPVDKHADVVNGRLCKLPDGKG